MNQDDPKLSIYCLYNNGKEEEIIFNIDLSYDPLIANTYNISWINYLIQRNFNNEINQVNILQHNQHNCKNDLPDWYYDYNYLKND